MDESLNKIYFREITFGPKSDQDTCYTKEGIEINCSTFLYFKPSVWADVESNKIYLNTQRFYILTHPDTHAEYIPNCSKLSAGFEFNALITSKDANKPIDLMLSFSLYDNYSDPCTYIRFPYLNPRMIEKHTVQYPFDYYYLDLDFHIPNISLINFEVNLPEKFKVSRIETSPHTKTVTDTYSNPVFFELKDLNTDKNNPVGFNIKFERYPSWSDKIFPTIMLLILPLLSSFYFIHSPNIDNNKRISTTIAFYMSLFALFFAFGVFFSNYPSTYSFAHASFSATLFLLIVSLINEFTQFRYINGRWRYICISVSFIIPIFFVIN